MHANTNFHSIRREYRKPQLKFDERYECQTKLLAWPFNIDIDIYSFISFSPKIQDSVFFFCVQNVLSKEQQKIGLFFFSAETL